MRLSLAALLLPLSLAAAPACAGPSTGGQAEVSSKISGAEAKKLVAEGAFLLDVRTAGEFSGGHLEGATNIAIDALTARIGELPKDKKLVVYCASGGRSAAATGMLREKGYDAYDLGPMSAWPK
jgi:rhodanese-related sulfurtransferase